MAALAQDACSDDNAQQCGSHTVVSLKTGYVCASNTARRPRQVRWTATAEEHRNDQIGEASPLKVRRQEPCFEGDQRCPNSAPAVSRYRMRESPASVQVCDAVCAKRGGNPRERDERERPTDYLYVEAAARYTAAHGTSLVARFGRYGYHENVSESERPRRMTRYRRNVYGTRG